MPQPTRSAVRRPHVPASWKSWIAPLLLIGVALAWLLAGLTCLWFRWRNVSSGPVPALSGVTFVACALLQSRLALAGWRAGRLTNSDIPLAHLAYWRSLGLGAVLAYLAALTVGHVSHIGFAWLAVVCIWQTLLLLPLSTSGKVLEDWRKWAQGRGVRRLTWLVYAALLVLAAGELALRVNHAAFDRVQPPKVSPQAARLDSFADVTRLKSARFRVAILGDAAGGEPEAYLAPLERTLGGLQIVRLSGSAARSDGALAAQALESDPDLVLAVVSVCDELSHQPRSPGYFDWRQFELATLLAGQPSSEGSPRSLPTAKNFETHLSMLGPQLAACRTPIDAVMHDRWSRLDASLDNLIAACRDAEVSVALLIVPAEFQVNRTLCETLLRRAGLSADRVDVELPQRRLAGFAESRHVPLIDLLPHLRLCRQSAFRRHATALSDEGSQAMASAIGGWLQSRYGGNLATRVRAR